MRALLAALVVFVPGVADAHECGHGFSFGDGPFCGQQGSGYWVPALRFELGALQQNLVITDEDARDSGLAPGTVTSRGGRFRFAWGFFGLYTGGDLTMVTFDGTAMPGVARGTDSPDAAVDGRSIALTTFVGARRSTGRLLYGLEVAGGLRNAWFAGAPSEQHTASGVLEVRSNIGVWLSPFLSVSAQLGQSVLHRDEHFALVSFDVSVFPWDGLR